MQTPNTKAHASAAQKIVRDSQSKAAATQRQHTQQQRKTRPVRTITQSQLMAYINKNSKDFKYVLVDDDLFPKNNNNNSSNGSKSDSSKNRSSFDDDNSSDEDHSDDTKSLRSEDDDSSVSTEGGKSDENDDSEAQETLDDNEDSHEDAQKDNDADGQIEDKLMADKAIDDIDDIQKAPSTPAKQDTLVTTNLFANMFNDDDEPSPKRKFKREEQRKRTGSTIMEALKEEETLNWAPVGFKGTKRSDWEVVLTPWNLRVEKDNIVATLALKGSPATCRNFNEEKLKSILLNTTWEENPSSQDISLAASIISLRLETFASMVDKGDKAIEKQQKYLKNLELYMKHAPHINSNSADAIIVSLANFGLFLSDFKVDGRYIPDIVVHCGDTSHAKSRLRALKIQQEQEKVRIDWKWYRISVAKILAVDYTLNMYESHFETMRPKAGETAVEYHLRFKSYVEILNIDPSRAGFRLKRSLPIYFQDKLREVGTKIMYDEIIEYLQKNLIFQPEKYVYFSENRKQFGNAYKRKGSATYKMRDSRKPQKDNQEPSIAQINNALSDVQCYICKQLGHYANSCPDKSNRPPRRNFAKKRTSTRNSFKHRQQKAKKRAFEKNS